MTFLFTIVFPLILFLQQIKTYLEYWNLFNLGKEDKKLIPSFCLACKAFSKHFLQFSFLELPILIFVVNIEQMGNLYMAGFWFAKSLVESSQHFVKFFLVESPVLILVKLLKNLCHCDFKILFCVTHMEMIINLIKYQTI